jgi:NAD-dependent deacetylase
MAEFFHIQGTFMKVIIPGRNVTYLEESVSRFRAARLPVVLTGAGISVESGIPDFRSSGGLWTQFAPDEYATLEVFLRNPEKAWQLYRAMGEVLEGKKPNEAHCALARLEQAGFLHGVITQNIDGLHQSAGSRTVLEIHGEHQHLQCIRCGELEEAAREHYRSRCPPVCRECGAVLKPNVVLFGEAVRSLDEIHHLLHQCDLLMVVGTSAQVYPAATLPDRVRENNGLIYEFNVEETTLTRGQFPGSLQSDYFFQARAAESLPFFAETVCEKQ